MVMQIATRPRNSLLPIATEGDAEEYQNNRSEETECAQYA